MSGTLRLRGATSGYSELQAPAVAADQTFILPTAGGTLLTTDSPISKLTLELGSASQPSLTFEGDTDTGLYSSGTNTLNLVTGGSNRLTIDSSGRVGINTTSPTKSLDVNGTFRVVNEATFDNDVIVYGDAQLNEEGVKLQSGLITAVQASGVNSVFRGHTTAGTPYNIDLKASGDAVFLGDVGIGNSSPAYKLSVLTTGTSDTSLHLATTGGASANGDATNSVRFTGGTNTRWANAKYEAFTHIFNANGAEKMRIDSSGDVGIGTASPIAKLDVRGIAYIGTGLGIDISNPGDYHASANDLVMNGGMTLANTSQGSIFFADSSTGTGEYVGQLNYYHSSDSMAFVTNNGEAMRIDSSGRLLLGTTTPGEASADDLTISSTGHAGISIRSGTSDSGGIYFADGTSGSSQYEGIIQYSHVINALQFYTNYSGSSSTRMMIDSSGRVLIAKSASNFANVGIELRENGEVVATRSGGDVITTRRLVSEGTHFSLRNISGTTVGTIVTTSSSTAYNESSDYRLKENVVNLNNAITRVKQLQPRRFNFIVNPNTTVDGFLAHEAQQVVPEAVTGEKDGEEMQGIDKSKLIPLLTAALQEAIAKIETLETKVAALEAG